MTAARERTALVVPVPEAEHLLRPWRSTYTRSGRLGMWAHVTLLHPFLEPDEIDAELPRLRELLARHPSFAFSLVGFGRFDERILYLAPDARATFVALMEEVRAAYPDRPPYGGVHAGRDSVPHCTIAAEGDGALFEAAEIALQPHLPLRALATEAWLVELRREGWAARARLPFGGSA